MLAGFFIGWGVLIGGSLIAGMLMALTAGLFGFTRGMTALSWMFGMLPQAALIAALVWAFVNGKTRTGLGILAAIGSMIALVILLVAACFGLMASSGGWH